MNDKLQFIKKTATEELLNGSSSYGSNLNLVIEVHQWLFNEACGSCPRYFLGYINRIKSHGMSTKCKYKLREGVQLTVSSKNGSTLTNHNITDELAESFLSVNPINRISLFQSYPKNYLELLKGEAVEAEAIEEAPTEAVEEPVSLEALKPAKKRKK